MLAELASDEGYEAYTASNLTQATRAISDYDFHAVLLDIYLENDEVGLDLLPTLRDLQPNTPAIVISGLADLDSVISALKEGAYDLLRKPFNIAEVQKAVRNAVEKKNLALENAKLDKELRAERDSLEIRVKNATEDLAAKVNTLQTLNEQLSTIFEMSHATLVEGTPSEILKHVINLLRKVLRFEGAFCVVLDLRAEEISLKFSDCDRAEALVEGMRAELIAGKEQFIEMLESSDSSAGFAQLQRVIEHGQEDWSAADGLLMPIYVPQTLLGVFGVVGIARPNDLSEAEQRLLAFAISGFAAAWEQRNFMNRTNQLASFGELVTEIAHDLRHPMTSLRGAARILSEKWDEDSKRIRCLSQIPVDLSRMESMVSELVNFYNPRDMYMVSVDIHELLDKSLKVSHFLLDQKQIEVRKSFDAAHPVVLGLSPNLIEAFVNLISNAIQAMDNNGALTVATSDDLNEEDMSRLEAKGRQSEQYLRVSIQDTGAGIAPDELEKIFQRFYTTRPEGHGLGLAAVKRIIKKNLGTVHVRSEVGKGSTFEVYLPKT